MKLPKLSAMVKTDNKNSDPTDIVGKVMGQFKKLSDKRAAGDKGAGDLGGLGELEGGGISAKKGGTVKKSGFIKLHKGEKVMSRKQVSKMSGRKRA